MYAIINTKTKKFIYGTDYRRRIKTKSGKYICTQRTSFERMLTYEYEEQAELDLLQREVGTDYKIVKVKVNLVLPYKCVGC